jgi:hypothetical protein
MQNIRSYPHPLPHVEELGLCVIDVVGGIFRVLGDLHVTQMKTNARY